MPNIVSQAGMVLAHGLNIKAISHYLARGLVVGWAINRESPVLNLNGAMI